MRTDEQNIIDSNILGYSPDLNITSRPSLNIDTVMEDYKATSTTDELSAALNSFVQDSPGRTIQKLTLVLDTLELTKNNMVTKLNKNKTNYYSEYASNSANREDIKERNFLDLEKGDSILEALFEMEEVEEEIIAIIREFSNAIYGKDCDTSGALDTDTAYIKKMSLLEGNHDYDRINYFNLHYDTQISILIGLLEESLIPIVLKYNELDYFETPHSCDEKTERIIKKSFNSVNKQMKLDFDKSNLIKDNIVNALHNVFVSKQDMDLYLDTYQDIFNLNEDFELCNDINEMNMQELESRLDELVKAVMLIGFYRDDNLRTMVKKTKIRTFFK